MRLLLLSCFAFAITWVLSSFLPMHATIAQTIIHHRTSTTRSKANTETTNKKTALVTEQLKSTNTNGTTTVAYIDSKDSYKRNVSWHFNFDQKKFRRTPAAWNGSDGLEYNSGWFLFVGFFILIVCLLLCSGFAVLYFKLFGRNFDYYRERRKRKKEVRPHRRLPPPSSAMSSAVMSSVADSYAGSSAI